MKGKQILFSVLLAIPFSILAQTIVPHGFNYQAVARDKQGDILQNKPLEVRVSLIRDSTLGPISWQEQHTDTTNQHGLLMFQIGQGNRTAGNVSQFPDIDWHGHDYFVKVEINSGTGYQNMGLSKLWSVPYSMSARRAEVADTAYNAADEDSDTTNELQSLSLSNDTLSISRKNQVDLSPFHEVDSQQLKIDETPVMQVSAGVDSSLIPFPSHANADFLSIHVNAWDADGAGATSVKIAQVQDTASCTVDVCWNVRDVYDAGMTEKSGINIKNNHGEAIKFRVTALFY